MNDKPEMNESRRTCGLAVAPCSAMDAMQAAEAKLREQIWRNENVAERFCDNAAEVKLVLAELDKLRRLRERQAAMIRHMEAQIDAYEEAAIP